MCQENIRITDISLNTGETHPTVPATLFIYFLFDTMWIIQLYSLLYGLYEILNKKIYILHIFCWANISVSLWEPNTLSNCVEITYV